MTQHTLTACHECDLLQREPTSRRAVSPVVARCNAVLFRDIPDSVDRGLAFTLGAAFLFIISNVFPIVGLEAAGIRSATSLYGAVEMIWKNDMEGVAALVFITTILIPAVQLSLMLYVLLPLKLGQVPQGLAPILRVLQSVRPWSMTQVFILGVLVALVKLVHLAHVVPGIALWTFGGLILLFTGAMASFNMHELWNMVREDE